MDRRGARRHRRRRARLIALGAVVVVLALGTVGAVALGGDGSETAAVVPVTSMTLLPTTTSAPTTLPVTTTTSTTAPLPPGPYLNGRLPAQLLTTISPECEVVSELGGPLRQLLADANAQGVGLAPERSSFLPPGTPGPPRITSCYRAIDMQEWWRNYYCSVGTCGMAAVPGTSRHGWGHAVDFQDHEGELGFNSPGYRWLAAHAAAYGFYQPDWAKQGGSSAEAWHWERD